jgi:type I restriction enzyme, S subunit
VRPGFKQTEVGVIPEDWGVRPLATLITSLEAGVSVNSVDANKSISNDLSVLKTSCVIGGRFIPEERKTIVRRDIQRAKLNPRKDTIIFSRMNTPALVGECGYVDADYPNLFLPDRLWMTRHDAHVPHCVRWLAYILSSRSFSRVIKESATGTSGSMKNISKGSLLAVPIPFPPTKAEQEAIAKALSDTDALIESLEQLLAKKRDLKQGAMQELLTGKRRLSGFEGRPGYKQTEAGMIPEDWMVNSLGQIGVSLIGLTYKPADICSDGILVLRSSNVHEGRLRFDDNVFVDADVPDRIMVRPGDILICVRNGSRDLIGKCAKIDESAHGMTFGAFMAVFRTAHHEFVYHQFQSQLIKRQIHEHLGATINQITNKSLNSFLIPIPRTEAEQKTIATILSDLGAEIVTLETKLAKARNLKQGMMQELLTGKIRLV